MPLFVALLRGPVIFPLLREVVLGGVMPGIIMRIFVSFSPAHPRSSLVMGVLQMVGHGQHGSRFDVLHGFLDAEIGGVALRCGSHVDGSLRQSQVTLGHPDPLYRLVGRGGDHKGPGIGIAHILACCYQDPAGDEQRVLAGVDHLCHPVERGIGIAAPHALDECRDGIVVLVLIVHERFFLDGFLGRGEIITRSCRQGPGASKARPVPARSVRGAHLRSTGHE